MFEVFRLKNTALSFFKTAIILIAAVITLGLSSAYADDEQKYDSNLWNTLEYSFQLEDQYKRPEVQQQINWLNNHKKYLEQVSQHSKPYLYYILQEIQKRKMPGELALLPMIESTYNPFAYSSTGAAGLWQFTSNTGNNFGLKQNWWFDGRRDIYNSTNAALNYLTYLHRFFNGNWMLAIAAYHSGEGTVQRAVKFNGNHQRSTNFWSLNLPGDNRNYVPKLLALARIIQAECQKEHSTKLPYISNTPYFTKVNVGTQIDLTNAAHLAGISYPELIKLNPGNNHWATEPKGPHTIVLPLNKVDTFVANLNKIPMDDRHDLLAKHNADFDFDPDLNVLPEPVDTSSLVPENSQATETVNIPEKSPQSQQTVNVQAVPANNTSSNQSASSNNPLVAAGKIPSKWHKVIHIVQRGESFYRLTLKYHVSEANIRSWNHMSARDFLKQGQKLTIWTGNNLSWAQTKPVSGHATYYKVQRGDSLSKIAQKHHVSVQKLLAWNPKLKANLIVPGQQVVIY